MCDKFIQGGEAGVSANLTQQIQHLVDGLDDIVVEVSDESKLAADRDGPAGIPAIQGVKRI